VRIGGKCPFIKAQSHSSQERQGLYEQEYALGKPLYDIKVIGETSSTGTIVSFLPDSSIFITSKYDYAILASRLRELAYLNKGITLTILDEREKDDKGNMLQEVFFSSTGLTDFINYLDANREKLIPEPISMEGERSGIPIEISMQYNTSFAENIHSYVNNINTHEGGTHLSGFRRALTRTLKSYADKTGIAFQTEIRYQTGTTSVKALQPLFRSRCRNLNLKARPRPNSGTMR